uniref:GATOR complex protein NPRL3 n=1 Tax=Syphacia muris TaxID=451379 RepID=A0A0N5AQU3_9BILA
MENKYLYAPMSLLFVTLSESHEQISFAYPFEASETVICEDPLHLEAINRLDSISPWFFSLKPEILAHLLSGKGATNLPFELKIDNMRYVGYPKMVSTPRGRSPRIFNVVFVVGANMSADLVTCYEELSEKIAIAIDSEQTRCNYLSVHMSIILDAHDALDRQQSSNSINLRNYESECFQKILVNSTLAVDLCNIFNDLSDYGLVSVFLNEVVEIGFCLVERCMVRAGLAPITSQQIESQIRLIRPYHAIFLLDDVIPGPDASSDLQRIKKYCTPDRSILDISNASGLSMMQVFCIVRHLLLWARAVVVYPVCLENLYSSSAYPQLPLKNYTEKFRHIFQEELPIILAQFSPPSTLDQFLDPTTHSEYNQIIRYNMVLFLLRYNLIVQLHTFIYLMEPFSDQIVASDALAHLKDSEMRLALEKLTVSEVLKAHIAAICNNLLDIMPKEQAMNYFNLFISMTPLLNGEHHIEDIMFRLGKSRLVVTRILEIFANVLCTFERPDFIHSQFS